MTIIGRADKLLDPAEGKREQGRVWKEEEAGEQGEKCGEMEDHCS